MWQNHPVPYQKKNENSTYICREQLSRFTYSSYIVFIVFTLTTFTIRITYNNGINWRCCEKNRTKNSCKIIYSTAHNNSTVSQNSIVDSFVHPNLYMCQGFNQYLCLYHREKKKKITSDLSHFKCLKRYFYFSHSIYLFMFLSTTAIGYQFIEIAQKIIHLVFMSNKNKWKKKNKRAPRLGATHSTESYFLFGHSHKSVSLQFCILFLCFHFFCCSCSLRKALYWTYFVLCYVWGNRDSVTWIWNGYMNGVRERDE